MFPSESFAGRSGQGPYLSEYDTHIADNEIPTLVTKKIIIIIIILYYHLYKRFFAYVSRRMFS